MKGRLALALCALAPHILLAQTITVTTLDDSGPGSLRQAIADVAPGGAIVFDPLLSSSMITLTSGELVITDDLTITGPGADRMAISGDSTSRVFRIEAAAEVTISDITIRDGQVADGVVPSIVAESGGGILNLGVLTLVQVVLTNNRSGNGAQSSIVNVGSHGGHGGAIHNSNGDVTLIRCTVSDNASGNGGDCVSCSGDSPRGGYGGHGGAIFSPGGSVSIVQSAIINNRTGDGGDCLNCSGGSGGNSGWGGAVYSDLSVFGGLLSIESSTVSGNRTGVVGAPEAGSTRGSGGGVAFLENRLVVSHSTITDNESNVGGGVKSVIGGPMEVFNSIIAGNRVEEDSTDPSADCDVDDYTSNGYNLVGDGTGCPANGTNDRTIAPADVFTTVLNPLASNGGPTQTHALLRGSPAVDQGSCPGVLVDQRGYGGSSGVSRIADLRIANADDGCDIGAFEYLATPRDLIVHFKRPGGWGYPHVHYFNTTPDIGDTSWPGEPMVHEGCGWYKYRFDGAVMAHMVFNGNTSPQTVDLFRSGEGWFDGASNTWTEVNPQGCADRVVVYPRVFLQGAYQSTGFMSTTLWDSGHLPSSQPYGGAEFADPLKHNGDETWANHVPVTDWSIVELRTAPNAQSKVAAQAAIHQPDGTLGDPITLGPVKFPGVAEGPYYIVVRHRNHLPVMSANAVQLTATFSDAYDFALSPSSAYGTNPMVQMPDGFWAMWAADENNTGVVDGADFLRWRDATTGGIGGYVLPDFNLDGNTNGLDFNLYIASTAAGAASQVLE